MRCIHVLMDLDNLQKCIEDLYYRIEEHKERVEYQAHLLDELVRPWPFDCTPQSTQDKYKSKLEKERDLLVENDKISKFDKEIKSVEDILQKARLLHEKETNVKPKKVTENGATDTQTTKSKTSANKKVPLKSLPESASNRKQLKKSLTTAQKGQVARTNKAPYKTNQNPFSSKPTRPRIRSAGTGVPKQKPSIKLKPNVGLPVKKTDMSKTSTNEETLEQNDENSTKLANTSPITPPTSKKLEENEKVDIDLSKLDNLKLHYSEFASELELPVKVKRLLATHSKLCDECGNFFDDRECKEKTNFMENLTASCPSDHTNERPIKTLQAANLRLMQCIHICTNVISVLKYQNEVQPHSRSSKLRWSSQQDVYLKSETLKAVEEICPQLWRNYKFYKNTDIVDFDSSECADFDKELLSGLQLEDFSGICDEQSYPISSLTYSSPKEVVKWTCEKLNHQCMVIERNLLQSISESYLNSLKRTISTEKGDSPSQELASLLQNAYGLLAQKDILLPAYVKAE